MSKERPVAVSDIDGTMYRSNLLVDLVHQLVRQGTFPDRVVDQFSQAHADWRLHRHRDSYEDYMNRLVGTYIENVRGVEVIEVDLAVKHVMRTADEKIYIYGRKLIQELKSTHSLVAISGSPSEAVGPLVNRLGFEAFHASTFEVKNGVYTGTAVAGTKDKDKTLLAMVERLGLTLKGSVGIGDTDNDIPMLKLVDRPIAFNPNKELLEYAMAHGWELILEHKDTFYDLTGIGNYQLEGKFGHFYAKPK